MVSTRKPTTHGRRGERRPGETLEEMFQRLLHDESLDPLNFTLAEARYVGRRIAETPSPERRSAEEIMSDFYGDWFEDEVPD